jgi:hypothetical protein
MTDITRYLADRIRSRTDIEIHAPMVPSQPRG